MVRYLSIAVLALILVGCSSGVAGNGATGEDTKEAAWSSRPKSSGGGAQPTSGGPGTVTKKGG